MEPTSTPTGRPRARPGPSLKAWAIGLLSRREFSRQELRARLVARASRPGPLLTADAAADIDESCDGHAAAPPFDAQSDAQSDARAEVQAEVDALLDWLQAQGYLSDARFIESRIHARASRRGTAMIRQELSRHGLTLDAETAATLRNSEFARAQAVWQRKYGSVAADARERARQARFLSARGFAADVVRRITGGDDEA